MTGIRLPRLAWRPRPAILAAVVLIIIGASGVAAFSWYSLNLRPVSASSSAQLFTVDEGSSARQIASGLKSLGLIRSPRAFLLYVDVKHYKNRLQAGTYRLKPSMPAQEIAQTMANGYIDKNWLTILPGKRLDQIKQIFIRVGYKSSEVDAAFDPANYAGHPALAGLPAGASLEGLLYPDSFEKDAATPAQTIVRESLDEMQQHLSADIVSGFSARGLNVYQGITLASIVYQESGDPANEPTVAQVFLSRLKQGMALGSDVTAFYAADLAGAGNTLGVDSPYNTRLHTGLPPGPIGNFTDSALKAVANPSNTDYLFFVAGDDGTLHFSHTEAEHEQAIKQYCTKECS
jgi:UPF0755 protein